MEMTSKTSLPRLLTTPNSCHLKYQDLHCRFTDLDVPWLDHLRKLRVVELRRDLRRNDLSILALQTKVKRLEERERSVSAEPKPERKNPDLVTKRQRSSNEETRSGNGSNSTEEEGAAADRVRDDVQSSASLGRKVGDPVVAGGVGLLEMIRSHPHGALFQRRLQLQVK